MGPSVFFLRFISLPDQNKTNLYFLQRQLQASMAVRTKEIGHPA